MGNSMFADAEVGARISKHEFEAVLPGLRVDLLNAQFDLMKAGFSVVIVLVGSDGLGCEAVLDRLNEWLDARYIDTHGFDRVSDEELERPRFWRYWRALPRHGRMAILRGGWPAGALADRILERIGKAEYKRRVQHIRQFEQTLVDDGTLLLKFFIHVSRQELGKRIEKGEKDPDGYTGIDDDDRLIYEKYEDAIRLTAKYIKKTSVSGAEWTIVEGTDSRHRDLTVARAVLAALRRRLADGPAQAVGDGPAVGDALVRTRSPGARSRGGLSDLDLTRTISRDDYKERLAALQARVRRLGRHCWEDGVSSVFVFEGADAAGKGGVIRRITHALPARFVRVVPIARPSEEERQHHYLWRFWRQLPRAGRMLIFDRSWYGRVLVERVEGFARDEEWQRAYDEINSVEAQLVDHGFALCKFWLHIDPDEQLRRFRAREQTPYKKHKITDEDYRNRSQWPAYVQAVDDMVRRTHSASAPWHLVPANDKRWARIEVLGHVCEALDEALKQR